MQSDKSGSIFLSLGIEFDLGLKDSLFLLKLLVTNRKKYFILTFLPISNSLHNGYLGKFRCWKVLEGPLFRRHISKFVRVLLDKLKIFSMLLEQG